MRHPTAAAQRYRLGGEERNGERADCGDVEARVMPLAPREGSDSVSGLVATRVDNVNKMHIEKDGVDRAKYPEWFASKHVLVLHNAGFLMDTKGKDAQLSASNARQRLREDF